MFLRYFFSLFLLQVLFVGNIMGQSKGVIKGAVADSSGKAIELANVVVANTVTGVTTTADGRFFLELEPGEHLLVVSCVGYERKEQRVRVAAGSTVEVSFILESQNQQINEVTVTGEQRVFSSIERINIKDFGVVPNVSGNFESILKSMPGVSSSNELSSQYSVRGGNFDENLVYVNDVEIYRPFLVRSGQQEGISFINSDMVSGVEFSAGGFAAEYGDKMSSVLNIRYRRPQEIASSVSFSLLGANVFTEGATKSGKLSWLAGYRYKTNQYLLGTLDEKGEYRPSFSDFQTNITYKITPRLTVAFLGNYSLNSYKFVPTVRETRFGTFQNALQLKVYYEGQEVNRFESSQGALSFEYRPLDALTLKVIASGFTTLESETFDVLGQYLLNELDNTLGSSTYGDSLINVGIGGFLNHARNYLTANVGTVEHLGSFITDGNALKWGIGYRFEQIDDELSEWELIDSSGYATPYNGENLELSYALRGNNSLQSTRFFGFVQESVPFNMWDIAFTATAGLRFSHWSYNNQFLLSPRASISAKPEGTKLAFHLSGGAYNQAPFYKELRNSLGKLNPNLRAQKSAHLVFGTEYRFSAWDRPFRLSTEMYYKWLTDIVPYKVDNVRIRYAAQNLAQGYAMGIDLKLNGEFVPGAESWASVSVMRTEEDILTDSYSDANGNSVYPGYYPRPTDQRLNMALFFQDYLPGNKTFKVHLSGYYGTGLPFNIPKLERYDLVSRMPAYKRVDIGFTKILKDENGIGWSKLTGAEWLKELSVNVEVFNLLQISNTVSYLWVETVGNQSEQSGLVAVPNFLTSRRVNFSLTAKF